MTNIITPGLNPNIFNRNGISLTTTRPQIIEVLGDPVLNSGETSVFTVNAINGALSYQWQMTATPGASDWADIPGETGKQYTYVADVNDDGKYLRVVVNNGIGTTNSYAKVFDITGGGTPTAWAQVGTGASLTDVFILAGLQSGQFVGLINDRGNWLGIQTYSFDGTNLAIVGNQYDPQQSVSASTGLMAALTSSRVVINGTWDSTEEVRAFDFDGTNWSEVGIPLALPNGTVSRMSDTRFAWADFTNDFNIVRAYDFDGSNFTQAGNTLTLAADIIYTVVMGMSPGRVAVYSIEDITFNCFLTTYDFDGTDFTQVGNSLDVTAIIPSDLVGGYIGNDVLGIIDVSVNPGTLGAFAFDGIDWSVAIAFAALPDPSPGAFSNAGPGVDNQLLFRDTDTDTMFLYQAS